MVCIMCVMNVGSRKNRTIPFLKITEIMKTLDKTLNWWDLLEWPRYFFLLKILSEVQWCWKVKKFGGASGNFEMICPPQVGIGLTDLPNIWRRAVASLPPHPHPRPRPWYHWSVSVNFSLSGLVNDCEAVLWFVEIWVIFETFQTGSSLAQQLMSDARTKIFFWDMNVMVFNRIPGFLLLNLR